MDRFIDILNATASASIFGVIAWAIMTDRVRDGIVIKSGLILMALGFFGNACLQMNGVAPDDTRGLANCQMLINAGLLIVAVGWLWRTNGGKEYRRRTTDWAVLDEAAPAESKFPGSRA